jgi:hypothetical protein
MAKGGSEPISAQTAVEDIIEAKIEIILQAAREILGGDPKEEKVDDGTIVLTKNVSQCPPQIRIKPVDKNKFRVVSTSLCSIKDCDYWQRCEELDNGNMQELKETVAELQGRTLPHGEKKWVMREDKDGRHAVEGALRR